MMPLSMLPALACAQADASTAQIPPTTISSEWQKMWPIITGQPRPPEPFPTPKDFPAWDARFATVEKLLTPVGESMARGYKLSVVSATRGGVPVLELEPPRRIDDGRHLIYVHGGGFTTLSARSTLFYSAQMAHWTGMRVVSIDYTVAPRGRWQHVTDQVIEVYRALLASGVRPDHIGMWGDSADGSIVAGSILKMRDARISMPGAVVLWSPWSDVTGTGDTYRTLADYDPLLSLRQLKASADAYADPTDQKHPYVSAVYGDCSMGFPPTLIQGGTREIFLSNMVRLYQALASAGVPATFDLYEGMVHVFQPMVPSSPETKQAMRRVKEFWDQHLPAR